MLWVSLTHIPPYLQEGEALASYLITLGTAAVTGKKCGLVQGWRECKLGGLLMNAYFGRRVYHWGSSPGWTPALPL